MYRLQVSEAPHVAQFPFVHNVSRTNTFWAIEEWEANFSGNLYSILLDVLWSLGMLQTYVVKEHEQILVSHDTTKPV